MFTQLLSRSSPLLERFSRNYGPMQSKRHGSYRDPAFFPSQHKRRTGPWGYYTPWARSFSSKKATLTESSRQRWYDRWIDTKAPAHKVGQLVVHTDPVTRKEKIAGPINLTPLDETRLDHDAVPIRLYAERDRLLAPMSQPHQSYKGELFHEKMLAWKTDKMTVDGSDAPPVFAVFHVTHNVHRNMSQKVTVGDVIKLQGLPAQVGDTVRFRKVLMLGGPTWNAFGRPLILDAHVEAVIESHYQAARTYIFQENVAGGSQLHCRRVPQTRLRITKIHWDRMDELVEDWQTQSPERGSSEESAPHIDFASEMGDFEGEIAETMATKRRIQSYRDRYGNASHRS